MTTTNVEIRRYQILGLLGEGGFGKVYRARMEGPGGFSKDVAIKLLSEKEPGESTLQRFRDESRILGLVRDRAVIGVEPPSVVGGRWAVIMEFVDGVSASALIKEGGPLPPRVALEVVHEVARALDNIYRQRGPDGEALQLVHRDLKPANIQITPAGEVKILDFGTARARFEAREATTTKSIAGTYGYIAPERLHGIETPAADIYSLGYVLYRLLTGGKAEPAALRDALAGAEGDVHTALELAALMAGNDFEARPTAREVEARCAELAREMAGDDLRAWAEANVSSRVGVSDDALVGKVLTTTFSIQEPSQEITAANSRTGLVLLASLTGVNLVLVGGVIGLVALVGLIVWVVGMTAGAPQATAPVPTPLPIPAEVRPEPEPEPVEDVAPDEPEAPDAAPADPPTAAPRPAPAPPPTVARYPVDFGSQPLGAEVLLDGRSIGTTPLFGYHVGAGRHRVTMKSGSQSSTFSIDVGRRKPTRYIWKGGEDWEALY